MVRIYVIGPDDYADIVKLWNQEYKVLTSSKKILSIKSLREWYESRDKNEYLYYLMKHKGKFVGFLFLQREKKSLLIKAISVKKEYRGHKFGKELIKKSQEVAKDLKLPLMTEVLVDNVDTLNWFFKQEFSIIKYNKNAKDYLMQHK